MTNQNAELDEREEHWFSQFKEHTTFSREMMAVAFKCGWTSCLASLKSKAPEFPRKECREFFSQRTAKGAHQVEGAEWMHSTLAARVALAESECMGCQMQESVTDALDEQIKFLQERAEAAERSFDDALKAGHERWSRAELERDEAIEGMKSAMNELGKSDKLRDMDALIMDGLRRVLATSRMALNGNTKPLELALAAYDKSPLPSSNR